MISYEALLSVQLERNNSLSTHKDLVMTSVYILPSQFIYAKVLQFDDLDKLLLSYSYSCYYHLLCGGFNGAMEDISLKSEDCFRSITMESDFFILISIHLACQKKKINEDTTKDRITYGKKLQVMCKTNYVLIYYGSLGEDRGVGKATYYYV